MSEIKMLPLPKPTLIGRLNYLPHEMQSYGVAMAEHNVAAKDAEIEALKSDLGDYMDAANYQATRAERLAEALRLALKWAEVLPTGEPLRAESVRDLDKARAALRDHDQEARND